MTILQSLLAHPAVAATGWALLHLLWQGAIVAAVAALLLRAFHDASSNVRYLIASAGLAAMVLLPVVTAARLYEPPAAVRSGGPEAAAAPRIVIPTGESGVNVAIPAPSMRAVLRMFVQPLVPWTVAIWLAGVLALSARLTLGWARLQAVCRSAGAVNEELARAVRRLASRMQLSRPIRVGASDAFDVPVVFGWLRPMLLFPVSALSGLTPEQIETIAAHELAHIRRHDAVVNLMQTAIETLLFYHPAVWWLSARMRAERENCCDDAVVALCGDAVLYARALTDLEELRSAPAAYAVAATGGSLRDRVLRLLGAGGTRPAPHRLVAGLACAAVLIGLVVIAPLSLVAQEKTPPPARPAGTSIDVTAPAVPRDARTEPHGYAYGFRTADAIDLDVQLAGSDIAMRVADAESLAGAIAGGDAGGVGGAIAEGVAGGIAGGVAGGVRAALAGDDEDEVFKDDGVLSVDELVQLRAVGVTAAYAQQLRAAGYDVSLKELFSLAAHDADLAWIEAMNRAGFGRLSVAQLVAARASDLTPEYVRAVRERFGSARLDDVIGLSNHDVDDAYIRDLEGAGLTKLTLEQLVALAAMGVDGAYVRAMRAAGFANLSVDDLVRMKAHDVDPEYVRQLESLQKK